MGEEVGIKFFIHLLCRSAHTHAAAQSRLICGQNQKQYKKIINDCHCNVWKTLHSRTTAQGCTCLSDAFLLLWESHRGTLVNQTGTGGMDWTNFEACASSSGPEGRKCPGSSLKLSEVAFSPSPVPACSSFFFGHSRRFHALKNGFSNMHIVNSRHMYIYIEAAIAVHKGLTEPCPLCFGVVIPPRDPHSYNRYEEQKGRVLHHVRSLPL